MNKESFSIQWERYKNVVQFIEQHFMEDIKIKDIEELSFYSYRHINRIYQALHRETIGKSIKRLRLEQAATYLKYTQQQISDIALAVGYSDVAAFSKAFKSKFQCSPLAFRQHQNFLQPSSPCEGGASWEKMQTYSQLTYELVKLPTTKIIYLTHKGAYEDIDSIDQLADSLLTFASENQLLEIDKVLWGEILDDDEITDQLHCRLRLGIPLSKDIPFPLPEPFQMQLIHEQLYAKFEHKGSYTASRKTYEHIFACWMRDVPHSFADKPILECYRDDEREIAVEALITEIYIPILA